MDLTGLSRLKTKSRGGKDKDWSRENIAKPRAGKGLDSKIATGTERTLVDHFGTLAGHQFVVHRDKHRRRIA